MNAPFTPSKKNSNHQTQDKQVLNNLCIKIQIKVNFCILSFIFDWIINYENKTKIQFKKKKICI